MNISKNRLVGLVVFFLIIALISASVYSGSRVSTERFYQYKHCLGEKEVSLDDRTRVDCIVGDEAQEYDFANKWAECIGQALYYGAMTAKKPVCVLIIEKERDQRFVKRAVTVAKAYRHFYLKIKVIRDENIYCVSNCAVY